MPCNAPREQVALYFDAELAGEEHAAVAEHVRTCPVCAASLTRLQTLRAALSDAGDLRAPLSLADRIRADIAAEVARTPPLPAETRTRTAQWPTKAASLALAASLAATALIGAAVTWGVMSRQATLASLGDDILAAHLRSLLPESAVQVASTDRHTVKPWFSGRLSFSPAVNDLSAQGFPLVGGRLDYLGGQRVAVVVYKRRQHLINVFMWPSQTNTVRPAAAESIRSENGYNSVRWPAGGLELWAISDLNAAELAEFQKLF